MAEGAEAGEKMKKFIGPVTLEQAFKVDGRKLTVQLTFPAAVAEEVGMENLLFAANRAILNVDSKNHRVEKMRREG